MKKRIVCVLLTLIMLLSLVPMGASAATHTISEAAITVLKQMTTLKSKCYYYSGSEFRIGYGTVCEEDHHFDWYGQPDNTNKQNEHEITEMNADAALRKALLAMDEKVNAFASANGLSLTQNQHDALVVFSYNAGAGWMSGNGVLKSVIINKGDSTELLNAMVQWSKESGNGNTTDLSRRKVEVNMYVNGIYSNTAPTAYDWVKYDPKGGSMPQYDAGQNDKLYTFYYDKYTEMPHPVIPTRLNYKFLGWYGRSGGSLAWAPVLNSYCSGLTLEALWQSGNNPVTVDYMLHKEHLASTLVYDLVTSEKHNEELTQEFKELLAESDNLFWSDKDMIDSNGVRWSHLAEVGGWVKIGTGSNNDSFTDSYGKVIATATVTASGYLNLRQEPGTDAKIIGALAKNDTVNIYEIKTVNGHQWGLSKSGWLCLTYTRLIMKNDVAISNEGALAYAFTGSIEGGNLTAVHVEPNSNSNIATYIDHDDDTEELFIANGKDITVTNLAVYKNSETWAKVVWKNDELRYTNTEKTKTEHIQVNRSGWVRLVPVPTGAHVKLDPVKYTVVADSVSVRDNWGDIGNLIFSLNKGVQVEVKLIALVDENMWGQITVKDSNHVEDGKIGYVNLASKYFSRDDAPTVEETVVTDLIATVINTDSLKVRNFGASYGTRIGTLARGTTVAVWESNEDDWYKVDSNQNGVYDYEGDGWCFGQYLDIRKGTVGGNTTVTDSNGNKYETDGTGKGIVANTYSGVNVRTGPGTGYAANGKLLPGTIVDILETANARKWGRVTQGWICMDYVTMVSYNEVLDQNTANGTMVESFDKAEKTTTTAVYTGRMQTNAEVFRNPTKDENKEEKIRNAVGGENVTIYELAKVTENIISDEYAKEDDPNTVVTTTTTVTSYWARINDGWVENPEICLSLNALDEKVHTQTGVSKLNVRSTPDENAENVFDILAQGDQVKVTALEIVKDKVWGRIETSEGTGWIRLDYMSEGEVYVKAPVTNNTNTNNVLNNLGQTSSVGGYVDNTSGYRYTGKVIRANEVNVRATPSTAASKTTSLKSGAALVIYETTIAENMAWGRCDAGWIYLYYVDLAPVVNGAVDARVVYNDNTIIYSDVNATTVAGSYARMSTVDIYEIVGKMARTEQGWINTDNLL